MHCNLQQGFREDVQCAQQQPQESCLCTGTVLSINANPMPAKLVSNSSAHGPTVVPIATCVVGEGKLGSAGKLEAGLQRSSRGEGTGEASRGPLQCPRCGRRARSDNNQGQGHCHVCVCVWVPGTGFVARHHT